MIHILLDTRILLDVLLERDPFVDDATAIVEAHEKGVIAAYIAPSTAIHLCYFLRKSLGLTAAHTVVAEIVEHFNVCTIDASVLDKAMQLQAKDFEDAVQIATAIYGGLDAIVTINVKDFIHSPLPVYSPSQLLACIASP